MNNNINFGVDEVGRGAFAGPVVTGAVIFFKCYKINDLRLPVRIDDSKRLTSKERSESAVWIYENCLSYGIGVGSVKKINNSGIIKATNYAFRSGIYSALRKTAHRPDKLLIDAFFIPRVATYPKHKQLPIVRGDSLIFEIAAASIIAKVYRDSLMEKLFLRHKKYNWDKNKGYGTLNHRKAIQEFGLTKHHRTLYCKKIIRSSSFQV